MSCLFPFLHIKTLLFNFSLPFVLFHFPIINIQRLTSLCAILSVSFLLLLMVVQHWLFIRCVSKQMCFVYVFLRFVLISLSSTGIQFPQKGDSYIKMEAVSTPVMCKFWQDTPGTWKENNTIPSKAHNSSVNESKNINVDGILNKELKVCFLSHQWIQTNRWMS